MGTGANDGDILVITTMMMTMMIMVMMMMLRMRIVALCKLSGLGACQYKYTGSAEVIRLLQ